MADSPAADTDRALAEAAAKVAQARSHPNRSPSIFEQHLGALVADSVMRGAQQASLIIERDFPEIKRADDLLVGEPGMQIFNETETARVPMVLHPGGGFRLSKKGAIGGILSSALFQMHCERVAVTEESLTRVALTNLGDLRRSVSAGQVTARLILGVAGVSLLDGAKVDTPWGVLRGAPPTPPSERAMVGFEPETKCIMMQARTLPVKFESGESPTADFDPMLAAPDPAQTLFPLACVLASRDTNAPMVAVVTWWMLLLPFQQGFGWALPVLPRRMKGPTEISDPALVKELERWCRVVQHAHMPTADVAARRLVSACAERLDRADALIDAVMAWENLVGTSNETSFRVTASLAKLLEPDPAKRRSMRKALAQIYGLRSRVVHGVAASSRDVDAAAAQAVDVAIRAMRSFYLRGRDWLALTSGERADRLLLEEP